MGLFSGVGVIFAIQRVIEGRHVEPIGAALIGFIGVGGGLLVYLGSARARRAQQRGPEIDVLQVAKKHHGRITAVLVASEGNMSVADAERELSSLAAQGVCLRQTDDAGMTFYLFPEMADEEAKRKLFFSDAGKVSR